MLVKYAPPVKGMREPVCERNEANVSRIRGASPPYEGMVERLQRIAAGPKDQEFRILVARYRYLLGPDNPLYHVGRFLALRAAKALFPRNIVDANELRVFRKSGALQAATYSEFVGDGNGAIKRRTGIMREFDEREFGSREAELAFIQATDRAERDLNPELAVLPASLKRAGMEINHPEANYHLHNGTTVFFEINNIDLVKAAGAALDAGADGKPAIAAIAAIYALLVRQEARHRVWTGIWYGQSDAERRIMQGRYQDMADTHPREVYQLVFNLLSDTSDASVIKLPDTFILLDLLGLNRSMAHLLRINDGSQGMRWGPPPVFPIDLGIINAMDSENVWIMKEKCKKASP
jgi:hypothetical protein